ncbi:MAG: 4-hydroxybenzoate octaprenyltransferase [Enterovibrio sp.]
MNVAQLRPFWQLARLDKPIGSFLLLWPTLWALFLAAGGMPRFELLGTFILGVFVMRSAGCVVNDFADRKVDGFVARTKNRPLPAGLVSSRQALLFFVALVVIAALLALTLNALAIVLSVAALMLAGIYPFMKRYMPLPQLVLGLAFSCAILIAYAAQTGGLSPVAWLLFVANSVWTIAYDTMYAMVDREDDRKVGIQSSALLFGRYDKIIIGLLQLATLLLLTWVGFLADLAPPFYWALFVAGALFVYQQWLLRDRLEQNCFQAFLNNNWVGMIVFAGIVAAQLSSR